jgi:hypothetical protein
MSRAPHSQLIGALMLALVALLIEPQAARACTIVIEDAGTSILEPVVALRWKSVAPTRGAGNNQMVGVMTVRLRLNLAPWLHRAGHIYLSLPRQQPGPMLASWTAQEHLIPGQVQSGNRVLVYSGPITSAVLEDTLRFEFTIDGRLVQRAFPVSVQFEMDGA